MISDEERGLAMKKTCYAWRMSSPVDFTITKCVSSRGVFNSILSFDSNQANLVNVFLVLKNYKNMFCLTVCIYALQVFFRYVCAYLYLFTVYTYMSFASYWRDEKELYASQKMIIKSTHCISWKTKLFRLFVLKI